MVGTGLIGDCLIHLALKMGHDVAVIEEDKERADDHHHWNAPEVPAPAEAAVRPYGQRHGLLK